MKKQQVLHIGGFTLTELLVTIGIIAILSAIAIPAYHDYTLKSKIRTLDSLVAGLSQESITYFNTHNVAAYPSATDLGYGTVLDYVENPEDLLPIANSILIGDTSNCGANGYVVVELKPIEFMGIGSSFILECDFFNIDNQLSKQCFYEAYDGGGILITEDYIPEWHNSGADSWLLWMNMSSASEGQ